MTWFPKDFQPECHDVADFRKGSMVELAPRAAVAELIGTSGDIAISNYVAAVLELQDFDLGRDGESAYEMFGQMLVSLVAPEAGHVIWRDMVVNNDNASLLFSI